MAFNQSFMYLTDQPLYFSNLKQIFDPDQVIILLNREEFLSIIVRPDEIDTQIVHPDDISVQDTDSRVFYIRYLNPSAYPILKAAFTFTCDEIPDVEFTFESAVLCMPGQKSVYVTCDLDDLHDKASRMDAAGAGNAAASSAPSLGGAMMGAGEDELNLDAFNLEELTAKDFVLVSYEMEYLDKSGRALNFRYDIKEDVIALVNYEKEILKDYRNAEANDAERFVSFVQQFNVDPGQPSFSNTFDTDILGIYALLKYDDGSVRYIYIAPDEGWSLAPGSSEDLQGEMALLGKFATSNLTHALVSKVDFVLANGNPAAPYTHLSFVPELNLCQEKSCELEEFFFDSTIMAPKSTLNMKLILMLRRRRWMFLTQQKPAPAQSYVLNRKQQHRLPSRHNLLSLWKQHRLLAS